MAICYEVRAAMVRESDVIARRNSWVASSFAMVAGGLAGSSAIYAGTADTPNKKVTFVLGLGSTLSTVPTFFYFGSDERQKVVQGRISTLDEGVSAANDAYSTLLSLNRARDEVVAAARPTADVQMANARLQEGRDKLDQAIRNLADSCN